MSKLTDPTTDYVATCPKCREVKQPLANGIPHYCPEWRWHPTMTEAARKKLLS